MAAEHGAGERIGFAKRYSMVSATLETEREAANAAEKVKNVQLGIAGSEKLGIRA